MTKAFILAAAAVAVTAGIAQAGPCEAQIGATQKRIDAWLEANAKRGPVGPQSTAAQLHRQPTPQSLAAAFDFVWENRGETEAWGHAGRARYESLNLSWTNVIQKLLA